MVPSFHIRIFIEHLAIHKELNDGVCSGPANQANVVYGTPTMGPASPCLITISPIIVASRWRTVDILGSDKYERKTWGCIKIYDIASMYNGMHHWLDCVISASNWLFHTTITSLDNPLSNVLHLNLLSYFRQSWRMMGRAYHKMV